MVLIKKCDVKSYFAARRTKLRLQRDEANLPDATGFSRNESLHLDADATKQVDEEGQRISSVGPGTLQAGIAR